MAHDDDRTDAPGWDAIDAALRPIYGTREPLHYGTVVSYALGGPDPIHGISAYANDDPPHWHFVTYGFTELWAKESDDPSTSGFGFELTFRPTRQPGEDQPPTWALNFLQNLGRYVFETGNGFGVGHTLPLNGPIMLGSPTLIHAASFAPDPELPPIDTPSGRVEFLQIVGLTMDELEAISSWNAAAFLELRGQSDPHLLTDLARRSWTDDPAFAAEVGRRTAREGSSCGWLALVLDCDADRDPVRIRIQSIAVAGLKRRLLGRLPYGRDLVLRDEGATVVFQPGKRSRLEVSDEAVTITLRDTDLTELVETLRPHAGVFPVPGVKAVLHVQRTQITDRDGNVVEVVE